MATQSIDDALNYLPAPAKGRNPNGRSLLELVRDVMKAIDDGLSAQHEYKLRVAHGEAPADAARAAFREHFDRA